MIIYQAYLLKIKRITLVRTIHNNMYKILDTNQKCINCSSFIVINFISMILYLTYKKGFVSNKTFG